MCCHVTSTANGLKIRTNLIVKNKKFYLHQLSFLEVILCCKFFIKPSSPNLDFSRKFRWLSHLKQWGLFRIRRLCRWLAQTMISRLRLLHLSKNASNPTFLPKNKPWGILKLVSFSNKCWCFQWLITGTWERRCIKNDFLRVPRKHPWIKQEKP